MAESRRYFSEIMNMGNDNDMDVEEDDDEKTHIYKEPMRRNLLDVFDKAMPMEIADERMSVFLRVRPFSAQETESEENQGCVEVQSNYTVTAHAPKDSHTFKAQQYGLNKVRHQFTFSRVFPEATTQKEFFDSTMLKLVQDFIEGQNCLVFTYGVTNSGKTYTIQGNARDAGILPRGLDVLFNSISGKQWPGMDLKPQMFCDVVKLSPEHEDKERLIKERVLKMNSAEDLDVMTLLGDDASDQSAMNATQQSDTSSTDRKGSVDGQDILMADVENRDREETAVDVSVQGQIRFSVWVSFAEIYNEQIFDLLEPMPKKKDARRPVLKLSEDRRGSPYIKGLKEINVTSADEAYKLLTIGQRNLKTACTRLNHCSSRSHCIFNIKIIRVPDKGNPKMARVSMLSLCDLAGSERHSKTHATGERLKEAGNINTSLLTLGRCIELLRYNQQHKEKENKIIPFRESRLTRLFQNFFCGRGKAAMIVNVSQCASMFDETLNVFKFSAIAKQVVMPPKVMEKPVEAKRKRTTKSTRASSICWETSATPSGAGRQSTVAAEEDIQEEDDDDDVYIGHLEERVEMLENKIREMKHERLMREVEIRKEVCQEMQEQFVQIEGTYSMLLKDARRQEAEKFENKLKLILDYSRPQPSKRPRLDEAGTSAPSANVMVDDDDEWVSSILLHQEKVKVQEKEDILAEMRGQMTELEFQVADLTRKNKDLTEKVSKAEEAQRKVEKECAEKVAKADSLTEAATKDAEKASEDLGHSVLLETLSQQLQEAKDKLKHQEKEISDLNEMLTDAGETFHQKEEEIAKLRQVITEDEEKTEQQVATIRELRALLEESKAAVEESERRLEAKNHNIVDMKEELAQLQLHMKKDSKGMETGDALKKCEEELTIARSRLKHEEEDFQQRQKALIHGYTAEINNLKSQMALLKSRNLGKCVGTSPMRTGTPKKSRSPSKGRLRKLVGADVKKGKKRRGADPEESFHGDVVHQLKEILKDSSLSSGMQQKLQDMQASADWLQQQAGERGEVEGRLQQTQHDLEELQRKFGELSSASTELQRQLDCKKELHAELTDNQSESAELRQKLRIAESAAEDFETRLAAASRQTLSAESSKCQVLQELNDAKALLEQTEVKRKEQASEVTDLQTALQSMTHTNTQLTDTNTQLTDTNTQLTSDLHSCKMALQSQQEVMETVKDEHQLSQGNLQSLKQELTECQHEVERVREKNEELQTIVGELKSMLNQTTSELEAKSAQLKVFEQKAESCEHSVSSNEAMLKTALSEANDLIQQKSQLCETLQTQIEKYQTDFTQLKTSLQECECREADLKTVLETKKEELMLQTDKVDSCMKELDTLKAETSAALLMSQTSVGQVEALQTQLKEKSSHITALQSELGSLRESYAQEVKHLKEHASKLQSSIDDHLSCENVQLQGKEDTLREVSTKAARLETALQDKEREIAQLNATVQTAKSDIIQKDHLLEEVTSAKEVLLKKSSDLEEQLKSVLEAKERLDEVHQKLQEQLQETEQRLSVSEGETEIQTHGHEILRGLLAKQERKCSDLENELQAKKQMLEDLKLKESARLQKMQSLEKAQKEAKRLQDKKLTEAREALEEKEKEVNETREALERKDRELIEATEALLGKEREVEALKTSFTQLTEQSSQGESLQSKLSEASFQIADLRSRLHIEQTLNEKHKCSMEDMSEEKVELERRITSVSEELEEKEKEKNKLMEEITDLKVRVTELQTANTEMSQKLDKELSERKACVDGLTVEHQEAVESKRNLQLSLEKMQTEQETLEKKIQEAEMEREKWRESHQEVCAELDTAKSTITYLEQCRSKLEDEIVARVKVHSKADLGSADSAELRQELEAEQCKNSQLQKQIKAFCALDSTTDAPGSLRRLRKEKIQMESDLAQARFEVERLQRQVERLLNMQKTPSSVQSPFVKCPNCLSNRARQGASEANDESLHQNLSDKAQQLHQVETVNQRMECELLEVKAKLLNTETELKEMKAVQCVKSTPLGNSSQKPAASAVSQQEACAILQAELEKSQEREASLRKELHECAQMVDNNKLTQLEEQLAEKTRELEQAFQREKERRHLSLMKEDSVSVEELQQQVAAQNAQLANKDQGLRETKQKLSELQADLLRAQQQRKIAVEDAKANELVIEQLKDAMMEQEETMQKQDDVMNGKDQEIQTLSAELEKLSTQHTKLCNKELEASRQLCSATRLQVQLEEEKKILAKNYAALEMKLHKTTEEKCQLEDRLKKVTEEKVHLKDTMHGQDKTSVSLKEKLAACEAELGKVKKAYEKDTNIYLGKEEERKALKEQVQKLEAEVKRLEEKCKSGEEEKQRWCDQRDRLVSQLEAVLKQQSGENQRLQCQLQEDREQYGKLLDEERQEKQELKRQLKVVQRAKDSVLADLRHGNHQLQVQLAQAQGQEPPPPLPPPQQHSFRVNDSELVDDIDTTGHLEVDATPPVAAKGLRKGRKRASTLNRSSDSTAGSSKSRRKPRGRQQDGTMEVVQEDQENSEKKSVTSRLQEIEEKNTCSPVTRSAKKLLQLISPERKNVDNQENTPVAADTAGRRGRRKVKEEEVPPAPFDCAPYQPAAMETRKSSRLRERRQTPKQQSVV